MRKRKGAMESLRRALNKNLALKGLLKVTEKSLANEKIHRIAEMARERRCVFEQLRSIREVCPYDVKSLDDLQARRRKKQHETSMHVVNCYMLQQERNKRLWAALQEQQALPPPPYRPVTTPDHLRFVQRAFPETCTFAMEHGWRYSYTVGADMYNYARASHDTLCFSTRSKAIGHMTNVFPAAQAIRFHQLGSASTGSFLPPLTHLEKRQRRSRRKNARKSTTQSASGFTVAAAAAVVVKETTAQLCSETKPGEDGEETDSKESGERKSSKCSAGSKDGVRASNKIVRVSKDNVRLLKDNSRDRGRSKERKLSLPLLAKFQVAPPSRRKRRSRRNGSGGSAARAPPVGRESVVGRAPSGSRGSSGNRGSLGGRGANGSRGLAVLSRQPVSTKRSK